MKEAWKFVIGILVLAALMLLYVHEQILLFQVSYALNEKSHALAQKEENYRRMKFEVDQLKSPRLLEEQMNQLALDLTLPKEIHVVKIPPRILPPVGTAPVEIPTASSRFMALLGQWMEIAQAKTDN